MLCNDPPLTAQRFGHIVLSSEFPGAVFLNLIKAPSLSYFISMILKP